LVLRDASLTVVGYCSTGGLSSNVGDLVDGSSTYGAVGGELTQIGTGTYQYVIYPTTPGLEIEVENAGRVQARADFVSEPPRADCPPSGGDVRSVVWKTCASIVVVEWDTGWDVGTPLVAVRGFVADGASSSASLGFYVMGQRRSTEGLVLEVGFQRPQSDDVTLTLNGATLNGRDVAPPAPLVVTSRVPGR
jgi:hypothetical protein